MTSHFIVYVLIDPRNDELFYVGQTESGFDRISSHISCARTGVRSGYPSPTHSRIFEIANAGFSPSLFSIEEVGSRRVVLKRETLWMSAYQQMGYTLTNSQKADHIVECDPCTMIRSVVYLPVLGNWQWWELMKAYNNRERGVSIHPTKIPALLNKGVIEPTGQYWTATRLGEQIVERRLNSETLIKSA